MPRVLFQVAHRDIKPENLLISTDFRVKLADFGLACKVLGKLHRVCGTPTYVAPEILNESGKSIFVVSGFCEASNTVKILV